MLSVCWLNVNFVLSLFSMCVFFCMKCCMFFVLDGDVRGFFL